MANRSIGSTIIVTTVPDLEPLTVKISVAAQLTGLDEVRIKQLAASGAIERVRVGRAELIVYSSLKDFIAKAVKLMTARLQTGDVNSNVVQLVHLVPKGHEK
ncbi:hypothetical protein [Rhizorhabdus dicambivorans]|uniref:hypothetical protein n=1 Tax=Rhizorhabdus dicambivorans TaxID=1850238 RepID=UPI00082B0FCE|nr:hypothetical protein [Rhizorhabdus dicambivorans]